MNEQIPQTNANGTSSRQSGPAARRRSGLILAIGLLAGCQTPQQPQRLIETVEDPQLTERELRVKLNEYFRHWAAVVELAADDIAARTEETTLRRNAMRWKLEAIPACQIAAFQQDPVAALLDVWALSAQMTRYLETGVGRGLFGHWQVIAIDAAKQLEADVGGLASELTHPERGRKLVMEWVEEHPIHGSLLNRPTTKTILVKYAGEPRRSALAALRNLDQRIADLLERLDFYVEWLPHQIRWQAEYVIEHQVVTREEKEDALRHVATISESLERLGALDDVHIDLSASARKAIFRAVLFGCVLIAILFLARLAFLRIARQKTDRASGADQEGQR